MTNAELLPGSAPSADAANVAVRRVAPVHGTVLVVDDDTTCAYAIARVLRWAQFAVEIVADGPAALAAVAQRPPDLILLDWNLPKMTGLEICERLKRNPETRLIPVVMLTGHCDRTRRLAATTAGADDFVGKPFEPQQLSARVLSLVRLKQHTDELESAESIIRSLALTIEARDAGTDGHCQRLAHYATALGAAIGLDADALAALERGGYLHDVGKIGIPDHVLLKPGQLTRDEYALMQQHTIIGERLCGNLRSLALVRPIVRSHHERLNGSGYPDGLRGDAIPVSAQIIGVVDTFDAITTTRPYRAARSFDQARDELLNDVRAGKLNPELVAEFLRLLDAGIDGKAGERNGDSVRATPDKQREQAGIQDSYILTTLDRKMFLCSVEAIGPELLWVFVDSAHTRYVGPRWARVLNEPEVRALLNDWWQSAREPTNALSDLTDRALAVD